MTEALSVTEPSRGVLQPLDLGTDALGARVGDALDHGGKNPFQVALDHPRHPLDRLEPRADRPTVPALPGPPCPTAPAIGPERHRELLDRPGARRLQTAVAQGLEALPGF